MEVNCTEISAYGCTGKKLFAQNPQYEAKLYTNVSEDTGKFVFAVPAHCIHAIALYANRVFLSVIFQDINCLKQTHCCHSFVHLFCVCNNSCDKYDGYSID